VIVSDVTELYYSGKKAYPKRTHGLCGEDDLRLGFEQASEQGSCDRVIEDGGKVA